MGGTGRLVVGEVRGRLCALAGAMFADVLSGRWKVVPRGPGEVAIDDSRFDDREPPHILRNLSCSASPR